MTASSGPPSRQPSYILALASLILLSACPEDPKHPLGASCARDAQCAAGACIAGLCLDPDGDQDGDGLVNRLEAALGVNPTARDSDGDGAGDALEIGVDLANPIDSDGDGKIDAVESRVLDADRDCIPDQADPEDATREADPVVLARASCAKTGVCAPSGSVMASCDDGTVTCDFSAATAFEETEVRCDGLDNDCDGLTDERHAAGGDVRYDGGAYSGDVGKALGASCGVGACTGGTVVCADDHASLTCSTVSRTGPLACASDMDCDGTPDESEVPNPITDPLAGCRNFYADADSDGYGAGAPRCLCSAFGAYRVENRDDCAEADPARYPMAKGVCGVDADCDGARKDIDEACDDGNDDVTDGCHDCSVVARRVAAPEVGGPPLPTAVAIGGLADGGFVIAWDAGLDDSQGAAQRLGRSLAFFGADGREVARVTGIDAALPSAYAKSQLAARASGGIAVGQWRGDQARDDWRYEIDDYGADGARASDDPIVVTRASAPSEDTFLLRLGEDRLGMVSAAPAADGTSRVSIKQIDASGQVWGGEGGIVRRAAMLDVHALGFATGAIALTWRELDPESLVHTQYAVRLSADDALPLSEPKPFALPDTAIRRARLSRRSAGWAIFFLGERAHGDVDVRVIGYQAMDGDAPTGNAVYLEPEDRRGCPDELVGGFDAAGFAWAVVSDRECKSPLRGWYAGATAIALTPFDQTLHPAAITSELSAATSGAGFVLAFVAGGDTDEPGLYVLRYGANAAPSYLP